MEHMSTAKPYPPQGTTSYTLKMVSLLLYAAFTLLISVIVIKFGQSTKEYILLHDEVS